MANETEPQELKVFTVIHDWPGSDEGDYGWAGEAIDQNHAIERCVDSMIADDMALDDDDSEEERAKRRQSIEAESPCARVFEGADIWQAPALMQAIKQALDTLPADGMVAELSVINALEAAYERGRGYAMELPEAQEWFQENPCPRSAACLRIVATRHVESDWIDEQTWQSIIRDIEQWREKQEAA